MEQKLQTPPWPKHEHTPWNKARIHVPAAFEDASLIHAVAGFQVIWGDVHILDVIWTVVLLFYSQGMD